MEKSKRHPALFRLTAAAVTVTSAVLSLTAGASTLYGDDFNYALYLRGGLRDFLSLTVSHYLEINGRAVVHLLLEIVLALKDLLFFAVIPLMLFGVFFFAARAAGCGNRGLFIAFGLCGVLFLPWTVLREGVFWMSGAMNYIFPTVMLFAAFLLYRRAAEGDRFGVMTLPVLFLAGASTEQGGAAALIAVILFTAAKVRDRKKLLRCAVMLLVLAAGYLTVMLSPATSGRAAAEVSERLGLIDRLRNVYEYSVGKDSAFPIFMAALILAASDAFRRRRVFSVILLAASASAVVLWFRESYFVVGIILTLSLVSVGIYGLFTGTAARSALLFSGLASVGMLVLSVTFGYRNILPGLLILIAVSADILCGLAGEGRRAIVALSLIFALGAASFAPVFIGYAANRRIINANLAALGDGTRDFYYDIDLDPRYSYNQFVSDGNGYRAAYRKVYNVRDGVKIFLRGEAFRDLYQNGVHCEYPVYISDGKEYYPFRNMIEAEGGNVTYDPELNAVRIGLHGRTIIFDFGKNTMESDGVTTDVRTLRLYDERYGNMAAETLYFASELYSGVLGIDVGEEK